MCEIGRIIAAGTITPREILADIIEHEGAIPAARVSSAQARGTAKQYPYWGAVRYEIRRRKADGMPTAVACERASSDRRSERLAEADRDDLCELEGRIPISGIGALTDYECERVLAAITPSEEG
jgi:hypothetical protein